MYRITYFLIVLAGLAGMAACMKEESPSAPPPDLYVPTAFTPDGDGVNDTFKVKANNIVLTSYQIEVFSPSNVKLYSSQDINTGWTGTFNNQPMPPDNYFWVIDYVTDGDKRKRTGYVELIR